MPKNDRFARARLGRTGGSEGIIASLHPGGCFVLAGGERVQCLLPPPRRGALTPPAPGDRVVFARRNGGTCAIQEVMPRRSVFARIDPRPPHEERVIAANIDLAAVVLAAGDGARRTNLVDRCLAAAWLGGVEPLICLNKLDLAAGRAGGLLAETEAYADLGVKVVKCSALTGEGLAELRAILAGRTVAFVGQSGVGKSSLLNALHPGLDLRTNAVRAADGRGRHTTTSAFLLALNDGTLIFDTPGFKEFGLGKPNPRQLARCFPEFAGHAQACRHADCTHLEEPDCAVRLAVRDGSLKQSRYRSYLRLLGRSAPAAEEANQTVFTCANCGEPVGPDDAGTRHRNHCPRCLHSLHLDSRPGDRSSCCGGLMEPIAVWVRRGGEWALIHRCRDCGALSSNRVAADDNELLLMQLAVKPLALPAFPLARLDKLHP